MTTRADRIAQVVRRRHAVAAERRRLLAFALHAEDHEFDEQITAERTPSRVARGTVAPPSTAIESTPAPDDPPVGETTLAMRVEMLRAQTAAFRTQAIALNAKLAMHELERHELCALRDQLVDSSARLSHAVDEIDAVTRLDEQLSSMSL